jgi:predicted deacylase
MSSSLDFFEDFLAYGNTSSVNSSHNSSHNSSGEVEASYKFSGQQYKFHVVFSGLIHGNEVGSLPGLLRVMEGLQNGSIPFGGTATFVVGNPRALKEGVRFTDCDLNRSFGLEHKTGAENASRTNAPYEHTRAQEITPLLHEADLLFDFHQTIKPSRAPFYVFSMHEESYLWARLAGGANYFLTRKPGVRFSTEGLCIDEYTRSLGKPGVTLELGEQGLWPEATQRVFETCCRVLAAVEKIYGSAAGLKKRAFEQPDFTYLEMFHQEPLVHPKDFLFEGLENLQWVTKGSEVGRRNEGSAIILPEDGYLFFPKYPPRDAEGWALPAHRGGALYVLARETQDYGPLP